MESGTAESIGATIHFKTQNTGTPKLLAAACGGELFRNLAVLPAVEMDMRGFASSKVSLDVPQSLNHKAYLADIDAVLKKTRATERPALFGYSHAGYFMTAYALKNPKRVSALILAEPALFTTRAELLKRARLAEAGKTDQAIDTMLKYAASNVPRTESLSTRSAIAESIQSNETLAAEWRIRAENPISLRQLSSLKMPVLLIGGTASKQANLLIKAAQAIPHASIWWIKGATHIDLGSKKYSKEISAVVETFLNQVQD